MPDEAIERERITRIVSDGFASHGYLPVETPLLEEQSSLAMAGESAVTPFQLFDGDGRLLVVRSDLTMPIARLVATRLAHTEAPIRLRYAAPVVREQAQYMARSRQFTQLGIELIGASGADADFEVVSMAAEALNAVGVSKWRIVCGSVRPMNELLAAAGIAGSKREELLSCVHASDFVDLDAALSDVDAPENLVSAIATLPRVSGGVEALNAASAALAAAGIADGGVSELRALFESAQKAGFADNLAVDFSVMNSFGYYTGLVFSVYADGVSAPLGSGGRYDEAFSRLGERDLPSAGFALSLEEIEEAVANNVEARPLRIAVPKGSLFADTVEALAAAGLNTEPLHDVGRHLIVHGQGVDYVIVRPTDAPAFVASGGADCGICGRDSLVEAGLDLVQLIDLGYGACRFVVAEPASAKGAADAAYARRGSIRVSTKYPRITQAYYDRIGVQADIVTLHGNIELGPMVGLSDRIVDITATGTTLRENDLVIVDEVLKCSARFFASPASIRCDERVRDLAAKLAASRKA